MKRKSFIGLLTIGIICLTGCGSSKNTQPETTTEASTTEFETTQTVEETTPTEAETVPETEEETEAEEEVIDLTGTWICEDGREDSDEEDPYRRIIVITDKFTNYFFEDKESGDTSVVFIGKTPVLIDEENSEYHYLSEAAWIVPKDHYDNSFSFQNKHLFYSDGHISRNDLVFEKGIWKTNIDFTQYKTVDIDQDEFYKVADAIIDEDYYVYTQGGDSLIGVLIDEYGYPEGVTNEDLSDSLKIAFTEYNSSGISDDSDLYWDFCSGMTFYVCTYLDGTFEEDDPDSYAAVKRLVKYQNLAECTAEELIKALNENPLRASNTYKGKYILLHGYLNNIDSSGKYISVRSKDKYSLVNIQCFIQNEEQINRVMDMNIGNEIALIGKVTEVGELMGYAIYIEEFL